MGVEIDDTSTPLVSVIITAYNRSEYLKETLKSIQEQTYTNLEIIVVDDGSMPEEAHKNKVLCRAFSKCNYYYKPNSGQPDSRNFGIKRSKGEFISFCDDDDLWALDKLEKQLAIFKNHPNYAVVTGAIEYVNENSSKTGEVKCHKEHSHGDVFKSLLMKNRTASIVPLIKLEVFNKVGYFNSDFTIGEDWEFWRRVSYYYKFYALPDVLGYVRLHGQNMSDSRTTDPLERFLLYRKLTKALLTWGADKFDKKDRQLILEQEWLIYRKMLASRYPSFFKKGTFFKRVSINNIQDMCHLVRLYVKHELLT